MSDVVDQHLREACNAARDPEVRYHIRQAMQHRERVLAQKGVSGMLTGGKR